MSSYQFIETLKDIGYPKADKLDPEALEWAFENAATQPFLQWFCSSVNADNVVSSTDIEEFNSINETCLLNQDQLEETMKNVSLGDADIDKSADDLQSDVLQLKKSLERFKARENALMKRCNKLSLHQMALQNKLVKAEEVEKSCLKINREAANKCRSQSAKVGEALERLIGSVQEITNLYRSDFQKQKKGNECASLGHFLSQMDLKDLYVAEERYSRDLTTFTKKQFFEGIADMAGDGEGNSYKILDVSSPGNASQADFEEFSRLQQILPRSEFDCVNALVNAKKALSAVQEATSVLNMLKSGQFPVSPVEISRLHHVTEENIFSARAEAAPLLSSVSSLIQELGKLQGTEVLTGDYELKLKRQDYFVQKQDKVIKCLVNQWARNEFLSMLFEKEARWHKETHHLLSATRQTLETHFNKWKQCMNDLNDPDLTEKRLQRSVVDTQDASTFRVYQLLGGSKEEEKLYLPQQKVKEKAKDFNQSNEAAQLTDQTMDDKYAHKVEQLESCTEECKSVLYCGSSTSSGYPTLSPPEVLSAMASLTSHFETLESQILPIVSDINAKKMTLKRNRLQNKERELFCLFHNNPSRLQYVVNTLADEFKTEGNVN